MIALEYQILIAILLDQLFGDPRWLPHPVRLIGAACHWCEQLTRAVLPPFIAGIASVLLVLALTGTTTWGIIAGTTLLHPWLGTAISILILYTTIAARDLVRHSTEVYTALQGGDLPEARKRVSMIVGRDTAGLDESGVARAAVESVAESMVDGVTAPLFFALLGGPVGAMLYKAINTMDSMFGYKNEHYRKFGWGPARLDDLANFVPARITSLMIPAAAFPLGLEPKRSLLLLLRDRFAHASPNSGHSEAAVAGALGVQLGGPNSYFGRVVKKPTIGDATRPIEPQDILRANRLMLLSSAFTLLACIALRKHLLALLPAMLP
ncbi:adenosylcobinamide-phosphate synthase CbiB [Thiovibrio frasassiensis]|uniref:Cobalamin biosynthesis protein CobD n=1 Tax=Thiovibrio frasassiensis TaxID=2984131 RepID=A0A9X4MGH0_9BACT|nr:adenosylcobinamide-phosphate synthase CbiB [Thiovibrio frasassiensis]MDG4475886.1 adenosylcobinamide-phosphate synthase CbiB [Thiovibrio frasassiensis]